MVPIAASTCATPAAQAAWSDTSQRKVGRARFVAAICRSDTSACSLKRGADGRADAGRTAGYKCRSHDILSMFLSWGTSHRRN